MNTIKHSSRFATACFPFRQTAVRYFASYATNAKANAPDLASKDNQRLAANAEDAATKAKSTHKTVAEADAELMEKLAGHADEGGAAGVEYEDGKPVAQKRSVRNNMFRLI